MPATPIPASALSLSSSRSITTTTPTPCWQPRADQNHIIDLPPNSRRQIPPPPLNKPRLAHRLPPLPAPPTIHSHHDDDSNTDIKINSHHSNKYRQVCPPRRQGHPAHPLLEARSLRRPARRPAPAHRHPAGAHPAAAVPGPPPPGLPVPPRRAPAHRLAVRPVPVAPQRAPPAPLVHRPVHPLRARARRPAAPRARRRQGGGR